MVLLCNRYALAKPGFLEGGSDVLEEGFALLILSDFSEISNENEIIWSQ